MADGIGSMSRSMLGIVGLDGTNTDCSQLRWKTTSKGKRSRKSVTRTGHSMLASETPTRLEELSGSDTEKFEEPSLADGLGCVPIKKRRHLSPSPSRSIELLPSQQGIPSSHSENFELLSYNTGLSDNQSSDLHSDLQILAGVLLNSSDDGLVGNNTVLRDDTVNLSGIALLATAACFSSMDDDSDNVKQDVTEEYPTFRKCIDKFSVTIPMGEPIQERSDPVYEAKCSSFAEDSSDHILVKKHQETESISASTNVDRFCWDLNKVMEEWEIPQDDLVFRKNSVCEASSEEICSVQPDSISNGNVSLASADVSTLFKSKVGNTHEVAITEVDDNDEHVESILQNYEHQTSIPEVGGLELKDVEDSQKTSELSEDRTILLEDVVGKTYKTSDAVGISTSDISIADLSFVCGVGTGQEEKAIVTDAMDTNDTSDHRDLLVSKREVVRTLIPRDSVKTLADDDCQEAYVDDDDHGTSDATQNISEPQLDYNSSYEDGELRVPAFSSCDGNEIGEGEDYECVDYESDGIVVGGEDSDPGDWPGSEIVEAGSESSQSAEKKYSLPAQISETVAIYSSLDFKKVMEENIVECKPEAKKHSNQWCGTTADVLSGASMQDNNIVMERKHNVDLTDRINSQGCYSGEIELAREKSQLCVEGTSPFDTSNRSYKFDDSFSRSERNRGTDRYVMRRGCSFKGNRQNGGYSHWNCRDSSNHCYDRGRPDVHWQQTRTRKAADYNTDKFNDVNSYDEHDHQPSKFVSKGIQRQFFRRRSPADSDDYNGDDRERFSHASGYNNRVSFVKISGGRRKEYAEPVVYDFPSSGRFSGYLSSGPPEISDSSWKSRSISRSRTRSPHVRQIRRERNLNNSRRSRSPEFRTESSIERARVRFQKRNFNNADYIERFISPSKPRFSPTQNNRWANDKKFSNPLRHGRAPPVVGVFRQQSQRWSDEHLMRPGGRCGEFGAMGDKLEENCANVMKHSGTSNILRRRRYDDDDDDDGDGNFENDDSFFSNEGMNNNSPCSSYRKSSLGMLRQAQRQKQDNYFRSINRPGRYTGGDWGK